MYDQILNRLSTFISLNKSEQEQFIDKLQIKHFNKKELILQEGQVCKYAYFLNYGCLRYYYNIKGQENTAEFFFENGWYTDYASFLTGKPGFLLTHLQVAIIKISNYRCICLIPQVLELATASIQILISVLNQNFIVGKFITRTKSKKLKIK
jgi:hypothetical protein